MLVKLLYSFLEDLTLEKKLKSVSKICVINLDDIRGKKQTFLTPTNTVLETFEVTNEETCKIKNFRPFNNYCGMWR